jgi:hypothetical protein
VRTTKVDDRIKGSVIGSRRSAMAKAKVVRLGSILVSAQVLRDVDITQQAGQLPQQRHLPEGTVEHLVKLADDQVETYTIEHVVRETEAKLVRKKFSISSGQSIVVRIRASYDVQFFKAGSPFKGWLDNIR